MSVHTARHVLGTHWTSCTVCAVTSGEATLTDAAVMNYCTAQFDHAVLADMHLVGIPTYICISTLLVDMCLWRNQLIELDS